MFLQTPIWTAGKKGKVVKEKPDGRERT